MRIALAQLNPTVGDIAGNRDRLGRAVEEAARRGAELVVASELYLTGYPPRDLVERDGFVRENLEARDGLARGLSAGPALLVGFVDRVVPDASRQPGKPLYNAAA